MGLGPLGCRYLRWVGVAAVIPALLFSPPVGAHGGGTPGPPARMPRVVRDDKRPAGLVATAYGQVVASSATAFVIQLADGTWLALNLTPSTAVSGPAGLAGGGTPLAIPPGDWVWVQYGLGAGGIGSPYVATVVRYAPTPFAVGPEVRLAGTVVAVGTSGFTLDARGRLYLVAVSPQTLVRLGRVLSALTFIQAGDTVVVQGRVSGSTLVATLVQYAVPGRGRGSGGPQGPHPGRGNGNKGDRGQGHEGDD